MKLSTFCLYDSKKLHSQRSSPIKTNIQQIIYILLLQEDCQIYKTSICSLTQHLTMIDKDHLIIDKYDGLR